MMIVALAAVWSVLALPTVVDLPVIDVRDVDRHAVITPAEPAVRSAEVWTLVWDDEVDGGITGIERTCQVDLQIRNGTVAGGFVGLVLGEQRDASFTGTSLDTGRGAVLNFQQDEPGYRCVYAGRQTEGGHIVGTWYDTVGRSGDFIMSKVGAVVAE